MDIATEELKKYLRHTILAPAADLVDKREYALELLIKLEKMYTGDNEITIKYAEPNPTNLPRGPLL